MRILQVSLVLIALLVSAVLAGGQRTSVALPSAGALPPAGSDRLPVVATVDVTSRIGDESLTLTGWAQVDREAPHDEGGVQVMDVEIVGMSLVGPSAVGAINAEERPNAGPSYVSSGEVRAKQAGQDFPASSFFDMFVDVSVPVTFPGGDTIIVHNEAPMRLNPTTNLTAWPPLGATYELEPIYNFDNDGDGAIDEDTADDDGDGLVDEDRPGEDPDTPGSGSECGTNPDCDGAEGEDPPIGLCTLVLCDGDGDGSIDEDPSCIPLMNAGNVNNMKAGFCVRNITLEFAPELPSYSVASGGPSGLHPADIHALTPGTVPSGGPLPPSGNDDFANAWPVPSLPFMDSQSTVGATTETGEPLPCGIKGATVWFEFTPNQSGTVLVETAGSTYDTVVAAYSGSTLPTLVNLGCNDDTFGLGFQSRISFSVTSGTTYYVQAGGFNGATGDLVQSIYFSGSPPVPTPPDPQAPFVRIPCESLGLTAEGCDPASGVDDLNALSYGADLPLGGAEQVFFSVGPGAQGAAGSAVEEQRNCPSPEPESDEFSTIFLGTNLHVMDGNGPIGACTPAFPLSLIESSVQRDDLDAVYGQDPIAVDADLNGVPESNVYFSLGSGSPSLGGLGFSSGDVLKTVNGATPTVYAGAAVLGLTAGDDLDGLCLGESGDGVFGLGDSMFFTLAAGSPTLASISAGPGDILAPGPEPTVVQDAASMGLQAADDVNAIKCLGVADPKDPDGDTDGDTIVNSLDPDDDNDGCLDEEENLPEPIAGGLRDPHWFWDFYTVWTGLPATLDTSVTITDIGGVVSRFGSVADPLPTKEEAFAEALTPPPPAPAYHSSYDRGGPIPNQNLWNLLPPDGSVTIVDIGSVVAQFGHACG